MAAVAGPHGFSRAFSSSKSLSRAPVAVMPQGLLVPHGGRSCSPGPSVAGVQRRCLLVAPGEQVGSRRSSSGSTSVPAAAHGCISVGLGGPSFSPGGFSALVVGSECHPDD